MNHEETIKRIQELVPSVMALELKCSDCNGDGWYSDHDTPRSHGEYGECISCPVQVGCETCTGTGILGKPITLAVIFQVILKHNEPDSEEEGIKLDSDIISLVRGHFGYKGWNLSKDNFNDQSEETKTFIGELLK